MLFELFLKLKRKFTNEYFIDFTNDYICIKKYPNTILINSKFNDLTYNSRLHDKSNSFFHLFFKFFKKQSLSKYKNQYFDSFSKLPISLFIDALKIIKVNSKESFVKPRIFMSISPNLSLQDRKSIQNILEMFNVRAIFYFNRILAIMITTKIEDKKLITFYINSQKCYRTIYFAGGVYDITELDCNYYNISNQKIDEFISELKSKAIEIPEDFSSIKKNNKDLYLKLEKIWFEGFDEEIYIIYEKNPTLINLNQKNLIKIQSSTSELPIKGIELFFETIINKNNGV